MRKKVLLVVLFATGVLVGLGATSVFAQEPPKPDSTTTVQDMQQACANGDYEAMAQLHEQCQSGEGGMMGDGQNGMMGGGQNGMMGGWYR